MTDQKSHASDCDVAQTDQKSHVSDCEVAPRFVFPTPYIVADGEKPCCPAYYTCSAFASAIAQRVSSTSLRRSMPLKTQFVVAASFLPFASLTVGMQDGCRADASENIIRVVETFVKNADDDSRVAPILRDFRAVVEADKADVRAGARSEEVRQYLSTFPNANDALIAVDTPAQIRELLHSCDVHKCPNFCTGVFQLMLRTDAGMMALQNDECPIPNWPWVCNFYK